MLQHALPSACSAEVVEWRGRAALGEGEGEAVVEELLAFVDAHTQAQEVSGYGARARSPYPTEFKFAGTHRTVLAVRFWLTVYRFGCTTYHSRYVMQCLRMKPQQA